MIGDFEEVIGLQRDNAKILEFFFFFSDWSVRSATVNTVTWRCISRKGTKPATIGAIHLLPFPVLIDQKAQAFIKN